MRRYLFILAASMLLGIGLATPLRAQNVDYGAQRKMLKSQQKLEWHALMVQQQARKQSWKGRQVSGAERALANHQMERERRDMKMRQKDQMQDLKDRQRNLQEMQRAYH